MKEESSFPKEITESYIAYSPTPRGFSKISSSTDDPPFEKSHILIWQNAQDSQVKNLILYLHGKSEILEDLAYLFQVTKKVVEEKAPLLNGGVAFVSMDYPCYGKSSGGFVPSEASFALAVHSAINNLSEKYSNANINIWGRSLGAAVALSAYQSILENRIMLIPFSTVGNGEPPLPKSKLSNRISSFVLITPWDSFQNTCFQNLNKRWFSFISLPFFDVKNFFCQTSKIQGSEYNSKLIAPQIQIPTLILYSEADTFVLKSQTENLINSMNKTILSIKKIPENLNIDHYDIYKFPSAYDTIFNFIFR